MVIWYASDDYPSSSTSTKQHAANCVIIGAVDSRAIGLVADWQCGATAPEKRSSRCQGMLGLCIESRQSVALCAARMQLSFSGPGTWECGRCGHTTTPKFLVQMGILAACHGLASQSFCNLSSRNIDPSSHESPVSIPDQHLG